MSWIIIISDSSQCSTWVCVASCGHSAAHSYSRCIQYSLVSDPMLLSLTLQSQFCVCHFLTCALTLTYINCITYVTWRELHHLCNLSYETEGSYFNPMNDIFLNLTKSFWCLTLWKGIICHNMWCVCQQALFWKSLTIYYVLVLPWPWSAKQNDTRGVGRASQIEA